MICTFSPKAGVAVLDLGCGSGPIALSVAKHFCSEDSHVFALDQSQNACLLTAENARDLGLQDRITVLNAKLNEDGSLGSDVTLPQFDIIVSNPPYVPRKDISDLEPEILLYEDLRALDGGKDGLDVINAIFLLCQTRLKSGGKLFMEVDPRHPNLIPRTLENLGVDLKLVYVCKDFGNKDRFVVLKKT